jgi:HSP20 family protein
MNTLTRWDPFKELEDLHTRITSALGRSAWRKDGDQDSLPLATWAPLVDITEDENEFLIKAELPEVRKEDVRVSVENGVLAISGERKVEQEEKTTKFHRIERSYGSFMRSFTLPDGTDAAKVKAEFKDGILRVHLPKDEKAKPRSIEVKVS